MFTCKNHVQGTLLRVEVVLGVLDSNNNCYEVGRATSYTNGFYSVAFTPEVPEKYRSSLPSLVLSPTGVRTLRASYS